jgi:hypothetical protein
LLESSLADIKSLTAIYKASPVSLSLNARASSTDVLGIPAFQYWLTLGALTPITADNCLAVIVHAMEKSRVQAYSVVQPIFVFLFFKN